MNSVPLPPTNDRETAIKILRDALLEIEKIIGPGGAIRMRGIAWRAVNKADELLDESDEWR